MLSHGMRLYGYLTSLEVTSYFAVDLSPEHLAEHPVEIAETASEEDDGPTARCPVRIVVALPHRRIRGDNFIVRITRLDIRDLVLAYRMDVGAMTGSNQLRNTPTRPTLDVLITKTAHV